MADRVKGKWEPLIRELKSLRPGPTAFEREFVARVLQEIPNLTPSDVRAQYPVTDPQGRTRYLDFAIKGPGRKIAVEIDGFDKAGGSIEDRRARHDDALHRQNHLTASGWIVLRFSNGQVMNESARCAHSIIEALRSAPAPAAVAPPSNDQPPIHDSTAATPVSAPNVPPKPAGGVSRRWIWALVAIGAAAVIAIGATVALHNDSGGGARSEAEQRAQDIANGAVAPTANGRTCPSGYPIKANYRTDRGTRFVFGPNSSFYSMTTPTSCWQTVQAAEAGGYTEAR